MDRMLQITPAQFAGLLEAERKLEAQLYTALNRFNDHSIDSICDAYRHLYTVVDMVLPRDFNNAKEHEDRLWAAHHQGQKHFHKALKSFRKNNPNGSVQTRVFIKDYLIWLKRCETYYRSYITMLNDAAGGLAELKVIAHASNADGVGATTQASVTPSHRDKIYASVHRAVIALGDLARYRANEKLDKEPDFGPAVGWYGLAAALKPSNGLGHHQQAVVALSQNHHLRAIFHLYRSMTVADPHPLAEGNLRLEMEKIIAAFANNELIERRAPRDPEAGKLQLVGWFLRLHSMCFDGEIFRGHDELEQEVLAQLANVLKQRPLDDTLLRMVLVNVSAQYIAGKRFQGDTSDQNQKSFLSYFRLNLKTFTVLLNLFCDDLRSLLVGMAQHDQPLVQKLPEIGSRLLPYLRVYSNWLRHGDTVRLVDGFMHNSAMDPAVTQAAAEFWPVYARVIDLVTQAFPVWELEEQTKEISYMLEEDSETLEFLPLTDENTRGTWNSNATGNQKPRCTDRITRFSKEEEMLWRMKDFQGIGLNLALEESLIPLGISAKNRVYFKDISNVEPLTVPEKVYKPIEPPKPISYAQVARKQPSARRLTVGKTPAQEAQAERMVASLVDDDDGGPVTDDNQPITPPQPASIVPAVVGGKAYGLASFTPPGPWRRSGDSTVAPFASPRGHARVNSAGSARSNHSLGTVDPWVPRVLPRAASGGQNAEMTSPLLFGAGGTLWTPGFGG